MKNHSIRLSICLLFLTLFSGIILATSGAESAAKTDSCVSRKCHSGMGKAKAVHNPVKAGMCTACHNAVADPKKKTKHPRNLTITLAQQGADLCYMCHDRNNKKKVVHGPIKGGNCTFCHNPHQSPNKGMLKEPSPKICFQCHPDSLVKHKVMHPPVLSMGCSTCHDAHQGDHPKMLMQEGNSLCFMCHSDKQEHLKKRKVAHLPVKQSCVMCHNPHGSGNSAMLSASVPALCANCHPNEVSLGQRAVTKHSPMTGKKQCLTCHDVHAADQPKLLVKQQRALCLGCHDAVRRTKTGAVKNMKAFLEKHKNGHGPVRENNCASCHNPHGSDYWRLLVKYYPPEFYTSYSDGKYALCFTCHDKAAFTKRITDEKTDFRDDKKNLHFVHVNKRSKGRTCRTCHEVHADNNRPHHVSDRVKFNDWEMPINFVPSKNGGSCLPGCHGAKEYRR